MEIIIPAAGLSTRFNCEKPKFMLYDHTGKSMLYRAIEPYLGKFKIHVGVLEEHVQKFDIREFVKYEFGDLINLIVLPSKTNGPAETVFQIIENANINLDVPIFVKDCDSFFNHQLSDGNYVCITNITDKTTINNPSNKSYVIINDNELIQNIVEKEVVSGNYCVGGYKFDSCRMFNDAYLIVQKITNGEIYLSHVIKQMLLESVPFTATHVFNYVDVGTMNDWLEYNNKPVIFCDIDGTIICNQQRYGINNYSTDPILLHNNIQTILKYQSRGSQIIFTTARPESTRMKTTEMLKSIGFDDFQLLMNLNHSSRILINDYNEMNPYPRAVAINIKRDSDNLSDYF